MMKNYIDKIDMNITPHQAKYFANEIIAQKGGDDRLTQSLFDAQVDLNPHQIEAALFALKNPIQEGVLLADEVGLGKTVEAGLVLCQMWAERKRHLLVICPASLRKQWANELMEKFALPAMVVDKSTLKPFSGSLNQLFQQKMGKTIFIMSYPFAAKMETALAGELWDYVTIDEAHKLRNAHRKSNKTGQALKRMFTGRRKMLLSATPLQNSLMELYGLSTLLDEHLFGDEKVFRKQYINNNQHDELKLRMRQFVNRTLRKDVSEYIRYTKRHTLTQKFMPSDEEHLLYEQISAFLQRENSYALPKSQRHLIGLILRKLLASSPFAISDTLARIVLRLQKLLAEQQQIKQQNLFDVMIENEDWSSDWHEDEDEDNESIEAQEAESTIDLKKLTLEIQELNHFIQCSGSLKTDSKAQALLSALNIGFARMQENGAAQKAIIFTESVRTQKYLFEFLSENGYADKLVLFSGSNNSPEANAIYQQWLARNPEKSTGSKDVDKRTALIDAFKHDAQIMIATEAAAEGVNLQFCSLLINYDLPWNPQRVEQRIGRCHRYGQQFDVVVINFLNERNEADKRVLELLTDKFRLFDGIFGASDEILGRIESNLDFEKRIAKIYDTCRTSEEIQAAFDQLQQELDSEIHATMEKTNKQLLDNFDEDVHSKLNLQKNQSQIRLDKMGRWFWLLTQFALKQNAIFNEERKIFQLNRAPLPHISLGTYTLPKQNAVQNHEQIYRIQSDLGQWCIEQGLNSATPVAHLIFDYQHYAGKISLLEQKQGQSGWLWLDKLAFNSPAKTDEQLIFTACTDDGEWLDNDFCHKLFALPATHKIDVNTPIPNKISATAQQAIQAAISIYADKNQQLIQQESMRLDKWAEEQIEAAEQAIAETSEQINEAQRQKRLATTLMEQQKWEQKQRDLEQKRKQQRNQIWDVEDEIHQKRDELLEKIEQQLKQKCQTEHLFSVRWQVV